MQENYLQRRDAYPGEMPTQKRYLGRKDAYTGEIPMQ